MPICGMTAPVELSYRHSGRCRDDAVRSAGGAPESSPGREPGVGWQQLSSPGRGGRGFRPAVGPSLFLTAIVFAGGCERREANSPISPPTNTVATAGPQFWIYGLSEYSLATNSVVSGLGGRWISARFRRNAGHVTTREAMIGRITNSLRADGWKAAPITDRKYVLSPLWETAGDDFRYGRSAKPTEPPHWFFEQTVHVSEDAATLAIYCAVGW